MVVGCFFHFEVLGSGDSISSAEERPDEDSELKLESEPEELSMSSPLDLVPRAGALVFGALLVACGDSIPSGLDKPLAVGYLREDLIARFLCSFRQYAFEPCFSDVSATGGSEGWRF